MSSTMSFDSVGIQKMTDSQPFLFLNEHPIFPVIAFVGNVVAFIPMVCLLYIAQIAPLHNNCRYILSIWALSYGFLFLVHIGLVYVDFYFNGTGYMPATMFEPHRLFLYGWHVRCTTFSSSFEVVLSIERIFAVVYPSTYHFAGMAWKSLIIITLLLMLNAHAVDSFVHSEDVFASGFLLLFAIEVLVLATGCVAAFVCRITYEKMNGTSPLSERYQVKEAYEMSKAMIPALITSFFLKVSSIIMLYAYFTVRKDYGYLISYVHAYYCNAFAVNGTFSLMILLLKHPQLRKQTIRKFPGLFGIKPVEIVSVASNEADTELYFSMLTAHWK